MEKESASSCIATTTALTKNLSFQLNVSIGTEAAPWHLGQTIKNPNLTGCGGGPCVNGMQMYPGSTIDLDPGAIPSVAVGLRYITDNGRDTIYAVMDGINSGISGWNNLQWTGMTWYHKFSDNFHLSWEAYTLSQERVLNQSAMRARRALVHSAVDCHRAVLELQVLEFRHDLVPAGVL
jgi:hypothetical protein